MIYLAARHPNCQWNGMLLYSGAYTRCRSFTCSLSFTSAVRCVQFMLFATGTYHSPYEVRRARVLSQNKPESGTQTHIPNDFQSEWISVSWRNSKRIVVKILFAVYCTRKNLIFNKPRKREREKKLNKWTIFNPNLIFVNEKYCPFNRIQLQWV